MHVPTYDLVSGQLASLNRHEFAASTKNPILWRRVEKNVFVEVAEVIAPLVARTVCDSRAVKVVRHRSDAMNQYRSRVRRKRQAARPVNRGVLRVVRFDVPPREFDFHGLPPAE
jgi:hypothetical protein